MLQASKDHQVDVIHSLDYGDGTFIFPSVPAGDYELEGWCGRERTNRALRVDGEISDLVLETATATEAKAVVNGRVIDDAGAPVSGLHLVMQRAGIPVADAGSDRDGAFSFAVLWSGQVEVGIARGGNFMREPMVSRALELGREAEPITLVVPRRGQIRGRVVTRSGAPVARARAVLDVDLRQGPLTDRNGEFHLDRIPPGRHPIEVSRGRLLLNVEPSSIEVQPGAIAEATIVVEDLDRRIEGRVVDESGSPVPNATVHIARGEDRSMWSLLDRDDGAVSGSNGEFHLEGLPDDTFTLVAQRPRSGAGHATGIRPGQHATVVLHPLGSIAGKVETRSGGSPEEFRIFLDGDAAPSVLYAKLSFAHTEGRFQIDDLVPGDYTLYVGCAAGTGRTEVRVESGKKTGDVIVRIEGPTTVRGRSIDLDSGRPIPGASISITPIDFHSLRSTGTSKADGTFEIPDVPATKVHISAGPARQDPVRYLRGGIEVELQPIAVNEVQPIHVRQNPLRDGDRRGYFGLLIDLEASSIVLRDVEPDSPAARAGIRRGDEITHVDGADVTGPNAHDFWLRIFAKVGQEVEFRMRDGRVLRLVAELSRREE